MQPETTLIEFVGWVALHLQLFFFQIVVYLQHLFYKLCRNMSLNFTAMDSRQALCDFSSFKVRMCPHLFCFSKIQQHSQQKQNLKGPLEFICYDLSQSDAITQPFTTTTVLTFLSSIETFFSKLAASGRLKKNLNCNKESFYKAYISKSFSLLLFSTTHQH